MAAETAAEAAIDSPSGSSGAGKLGIIAKGLIALGLWHGHGHP